MKLLMMLFVFAKALEIPMALEKNHLHIGLYRNRHQITIPKEGFELDKDMTIKVDELDLQGPIITNGFQLKIDVAVLNFAGGAIRGFNSPATQGALGVQGQSGKQDVKPIEIFATSITGEVVIDGTGQKGGRGGQGLQGAQGPKGSSGLDAKASCFGILFGQNIVGTHGGKGGQGQTGGKGALPGSGGKAIPINIETSTSLQTAQIKSESGIQGEPGPGGLPGAGGEGGDGGKEVHLVCGKGEMNFKVSVLGGSKGPQGDNGVGTLGPGDQLKDQKIEKVEARIISLNEFAQLRQEIAQSFGLFHWARSLKALKSDAQSFGLPIPDADQNIYLNQARELCQRFYNKRLSKQSYFQIPACENQRLNDGEILLFAKDHQHIPQALLKGYEELSSIQHQPAFRFFIPHLFETANAVQFVVEDVDNSNGENVEVKTHGILMGYPPVPHFYWAQEIENQLKVLNAFRESL